MKPVGRLSLRVILISALFSMLIVLGLSWLFGWGFGVYTVRWATDLMFVFSLCHTLTGLTIWVGRALRFYTESGGFKVQAYVMENDRLDISPQERAWWLVIHENQLFIGWVLAGLLLMLLAVLFGVVLTKQIPPDTILRFMIRGDILRLYPDRFR